MDTVYFGLPGPFLQRFRTRVEGKTGALTNFAPLRKRLFNRRKRADVVAALLAELLSRPAH